MDRSDYISASEIGDYIYCKRGWWLRRKGLLTMNFAMQKGTEAHDSIFSQLLRLKSLQNILLWGGIILLVILVLLLIFV
jgi:CRISPR/Cas system-associated exonuclease Cas4 (RecB family)